MMRYKCYTMEIPFLADNDADALSVSYIMTERMREMGVPAPEKVIIKDTDGNIINPEFKEDTAIIVKKQALECINTIRSIMQKYIGEEKKDAKQ